MKKKAKASKGAKRSSKKLKVNKQTVKDLESKGQGAGKVKGGAAARPRSGVDVGCCDREVKENFAPVEMQDILNRLSGIPVETWNYTWDDPAVRHISPMAQDFVAAFSVGEDNKHIHPIDVSGV